MFLLLSPPFLLSSPFIKHIPSMSHHVFLFSFFTFARHHLPFMFSYQNSHHFESIQYVFAQKVCQIVWIMYALYLHDSLLFISTIPASSLVITRILSSWFNHSHTLANIFSKEHFLPTLLILALMIRVMLETMSDLPVTTLPVFPGTPICRSLSSHAFRLFIY